MRTERAEPLIAIEAARERVLERSRPLGSERLALRSARGRILAEPARSRVAVPGFDNSAMDGYAIRSADSGGASPEAPRSLRIVGESRAGHPAAVGRRTGRGDRDLDRGDGPGGRRRGDPGRGHEPERRGSEVSIRAEVPPGNSSAAAARTWRPGPVVVEAGTRIGAAELGALAAGGVAEPVCARRPRVSVLLTGDELVEPDRELRPGPDPRLERLRGAAAGRRLPAPRSRSVEVIGDDRGTRPARRSSGRSRPMSLVICGGVSVGEHDHVRPALESLGVEQVFWGVSLRPGKPTYFGVAPDGRARLRPAGQSRSPRWSRSLSSSARRCWRCRAPTRGAQRRSPGSAPIHEGPRPGRGDQGRAEAGADGWEIAPTGAAGLPRAHLDARCGRPRVRAGRAGRPAGGDRAAGGVAAVS